MDAPQVSVLIPTWNGMEWLPRLIPSLRAQVVPRGLEIVALDSESRDGTAAYLREQGVRVQGLPQAEFGHGSARNRLAGMAQGERLVFLSQDALPVGTDFVRTLIAPLEDRRVAGTWARNLPNPGDDALSRRSLLESQESSAEGRRICLPAGRTLADFAPAERARLARFNNVASAMSAETARAHPFPEVAFGEDSAWAARVLNAGYCVEYVAQAAVHHNHRYGPASALARYRQDARFLREVHGVVVRPGLWSVLRGVAFELRQDARFLLRERGRFGDWLRAPALRAAQVWGQYQGSR
ncbi:MAG: glycosyltransferase [Planctomycetota bacterium]